MTQKEFDEAIKQALDKLGNPQVVSEDFFDPIIGVEVTKDNIKAISYFETKIKLLEDNAFSDRARIGMLENELEQYKKQVFEEVSVGLMPFKYYVDQVKRLEKAIVKLDKEVFPEED
jgi:hypothetical protein